MERQVTITATPSKVKTISVNKATVANEIVATPDTSLYYSNLSRQWATKMDGFVIGEDYSSKYYAENAKISAETAKMEASTATGLKDLLKEDFDGYTENLNDTKNLAIEEINTTSTVAIGNINTVVTSSTEQINEVAKEQTELVASTANKALENIETLVTNSTDVIESLSENSTEEINTLGNTIKSDATDWIDVINATGKSYNTVTHRQITNCITEIPQDIKLELNNGVLTLKAGSKVYVPNGFEADGTTPKFDEIIVENDVVRDVITGTENNPALIFYKPSEQIMDIYDTDRAVSGDTDILATSTYHAWYDTNNNLCKIIKDNLSSYALFSLPIALCTRTNGNISSIDQVFNGFGYIGSTAFVTKGVKGLIPNGRNEDGTLNNIEFITDRVLVHTVDVTDVKRVSLIVSSNNTLANFFSLINSETQPSQIYRLYYKASTNEIRVVTETYTNYKMTGFVIGDVITQIGSINSFIPKLPFRAVDYSDSSTVSGWAMPSKKYIDLTVGASGTDYTAPANGWFVSRQQYNGGYYEVSVGHITLVETNTSNTQLSFLIPVKKGWKLTYNYSNLQNGTTFSYFRFIYAKGEV